jgi:hypothetical protein
MNIRILGRLKGYFFRLNLHKVIPGKNLVFLGQLSDLSRWISTHRKIPFTDYYSSGFDYNKRFQLYSYIIESENITSEIDYLEFGVSRGFSFRWWSEHVKDPNSRFYGFDTFNGLPEDWGPFKKGAMSNGNVPPELNDERCKFYQGLFQQTLQPFLATYKPNQRRIIHMDADLYSSTLYVLTSISSYLRKGDIILFDEFNVPRHEFKAFIEWTSSFYIDYEVLGSVNNFYQVAFRLK